MDGHPGRTKMFSHLRRTYYWPLMTAYIASTVRSCAHCVSNLLRLIHRKQPMRLFHAKKNLGSVAVDILDPLPKTKEGNRLILVTADRYTKLTKFVPLKRTNFLDVTKVFASNLVFKYGAQKDVMSDKGPQFARKLYQNKCPRHLEHIYISVSPPN